MNEPTDRRHSEPEPSFAEMVDNAVRRVATSIAIAGIAIALAIYARPGPNRFEAFATDDGIVRIDTRSGTVIGCETRRCMVLLQRGQDLAPNPNRDPESAPPKAAVPATPQPSQKALPAPAQPSPQAAPGPAAAPAPAQQ